MRIRFPGSLWGSSEEREDQVRNVRTTFEDCIEDYF